MVEKYHKASIRFCPGNFRQLIPRGTYRLGRGLSNMLGLVFCSPSFRKGIHSASAGGHDADEL